MDQAIGELRTAIERDDAGSLHLHFGGKSAAREAWRVLAPIFDEVLAAAVAERRAMVLHFEKLEYFNSSTIAALVQFIRAAQRSAVGVTVVYDASQNWQAVSFDALKRALRPFDAGKAPSVQFTEV
ncbi:MAG TPA: hypothetical protein VFP50_03680 [Anaeromyxobacteraceae bacterium]|nr:hypothetical protein [Anaeromyxobacteraceae bacterium]